MGNDQGKQSNKEPRPFSPLRDREKKYSNTGNSKKCKKLSSFSVFIYEQLEKLD